MPVCEVVSEVQGNVWKVVVEVGDSVAEGAVLVIVESMKMEIPIEAPVAGVVSKLLVSPEDRVDEDQVVAVLETASAGC